MFDWNLLFSEGIAFSKNSGFIMHRASRLKR